MYTEQDLTNIRAQQKKRWGILLVPIVLCLAGIVYSLVVRNQVIADVATIAMFAALIAGWDLFIKPLHKYEIHLNNVLHGMTHELECEFGGFAEDLSLVDGVVYRTMTVICYDEKQQPYDRMFYFDNEKPLPPFQPGQKLRVVYHDHELGAVNAL